MSDYPMLISNKLHSFRNFKGQIYKIARCDVQFSYKIARCDVQFPLSCPRKTLQIILLCPILA